MKLPKSIVNSKGMRLLQFMTDMVAVMVVVTLIVASCMLLWETFWALMSFQIELALQKGLFVLILLEMFYVVRSFIKYGSINVSIVINIGIIAAIKELILRMTDLNWEMAVSFAVVFVSLGILYFAEIFSFEKKQS